MLTRLKNGWVCTVAALVISCGTTLMAQGVEKGEPEDQEETQQSKVLSDIAAAQQLIAFGRGELGEETGLTSYKSPQALIAAGGILLKVQAATSGKLATINSPVVDGEGAEVPAGTDKVDFAADAEALFAEALSSVKDRQRQRAGLEALIQEAKTSASAYAATLPKETRGAVGGPRVIKRVINTGKTHNIKISFEAGSNAEIRLQGTSKTKFEVIGPKGKVLFHSMGSKGMYSWNTSGRGIREITVKVMNDAGPPVAYVIVTN